MFFFVAYFAFNYILKKIIQIIIVETEQYNLLSNYKLIICDKIESGEHKYQIILSKDGIEKIIKEGFYINNLKYYPVFNGIDFDDYFLLRFYFGSYYFTLFQKNTGKEILTFETPDGMPVYDIENQLLLYNVVNNKLFLNRDVYIYDLKNEKQYNLNTCLEASLEKDILWLNIIHWFNSFKIGKVTFDEIKLIFFGCYKPLFDENGEFIDSQDYEFSITVER